MKYKNPYYKKTKQAFDMLVTCNYCGEDLAQYRKQGKGGLLRLWVSRTVASNFIIDLDKNTLTCPNCGKLLGNLVEIDGDYAYKIHRSTVGTKIID